LSLPHSPELLLQNPTSSTNQTLLWHVLLTHTFRSSRDIAWLDYMPTLTIYHPPSTIGAVLVQGICFEPSGDASAPEDMRAGQHSGVLDLPIQPRNSKLLIANIATLSVLIIRLWRKDSA
jgi:hypothetical protein